MFLYIIGDNALRQCMNLLFGRLFPHSIAALRCHCFAEGNASAEAEARARQYCCSRFLPRFFWLRCLGFGSAMPGKAATATEKKKKRSAHESWQRSQKKKRSAQTRSRANRFIFIFFNMFTAHDSRGVGMAQLRSKAKKRALS